MIKDQSMIVDNIHVYPIVNFKWYYISKCGKIWSDYHDSCWRKTSVDTKGYTSVILSVKDETGKSRKKTKRLHRLIAEQFIPNPLNLPEVNHKNGITTDFSLSNLEWVTSKENTQHRINILGNVADQTGAKNYNSRLTEEQVKEIRKKYTPQVYTLKMLAEEYGTTLSNIERIVNYKSWKHI